MDTAVLLAGRSEPARALAADRTRRAARTAPGRHRGGRAEAPEYLALNPNGVVPTLVVDGGRCFEAAALAMTLADRKPQAGLAPLPGDPLRADYVQWMFHLANAVQPLFRQWWYPHEPRRRSQCGTCRAHVRAAHRGRVGSPRCAPRRARPVPARRHAVGGGLLSHDADALVAQHAAAGDALAAPGGAGATR